MTDMDALRVELDAGHPGTGAYSTDDATAADEINAVNRTRNRESMTGSEVINAVDSGEYLALTDPQRASFWGLMGIGGLEGLNPFGVEATLMASWFGGGSATITALAAARVDAVSRAAELNLGWVRAGTVTQARAL